jgi:hypothetical protein
MIPSENFLGRLANEVGGICLSLFSGIIGGAICGAAILVFGAFIGRSGTTGEEYFGFWDPAIIPIGLFYGGLFGAIAGLLAYPLLVRKIGFRKAILPAFLGTMVGGFLGAIAGPPFAVLMGIGGFFVALIWTRVRLAENHFSTNQ